MRLRSRDFWWPQNGWKQLNGALFFTKRSHAAFMEKVEENNGLCLVREGSVRGARGGALRLLETGWIITLIIQPVVIMETWWRVINCLCKCEFPWGRWRPPTQGEEKHAHDPIKNNHDPATYSICAKPHTHAYDVFFFFFLSPSGAELTWQVLINVNVS